MKIINLLFIIFCFSACGVLGKKSIRPIVQDNIEAKYFEKCLNSSFVNSYAKRIFLEEVTTINDSIILITDSLLMGNQYYTQFYLVVIAKSLSHSDGAIGEALSYSCKNFVESYSVFFFRMISENKVYATLIIDKWADVICSELILLSENESANAKQIFLDKIKMNKIDSIEVEKIRSDFIAKIEFCNTD